MSIPAPPTETSPEQRQRLREFEASLPVPPAPVGSYVPVVRTGDLLLTSGAIPLKEGKMAYEGAVGTNGVTLEHGQAAARQCLLNALGVIKAELGSLERVARVVKLTGFVSCAPDFYQQPQVMNAASDLLVEVFGERGRHARSAVGVAALPMNASVEIELIVEVART